MKTVTTLGLMAGLTLSIPLTSFQVEASAKQCDTRYATRLIGQHLTLAIKEQARREANAASVVVNRHTPEFEPDRLRIFTDWDNVIDRLYCG